MQYRLLNRFGQVQLGIVGRLYKLWAVHAGKWSSSTALWIGFHTSTPSTSQPNISLASGGFQGPDPILRVSEE